MAKGPEKNDTPLTDAQGVAVPLLASGAKKKDVAAAAGVSAEAVSEWLRQPHFAAALEARRSGLCAVAGERLSEATDQAITTLLGLMKSGKETTRLKAATFLLQQVLAMAPATSSEPPKVEADGPADDGPIDPEFADMAVFLEGLNRFDRFDRQMRRRFARKPDK
jgi:hypothetical protein